MIDIIEGATEQESQRYGTALAMKLSNSRAYRGFHPTQKAASKSHCLPGTSEVLEKKRERERKRKKSANDMSRGIALAYS